MNYRLILNKINLCHRCHKTLEEIIAIGWTRACFWVLLHRENGAVFELYATIGAVKK